MPCHLEPQQFPPAVIHKQERKKSSKVSVGTTHISMAAIVSA
jgi:hypothetical protein